MITKFAGVTLLLYASLVVVQFITKAQPVNGNLSAIVEHIEAKKSELTVTAELRIAVPGTSARGTIVKEEHGTLTLNTRPCQDGENLVIFRGQYKKTPAGRLKCDDRWVDLYVVTRPPLKIEDL